MGGSLKKQAGGNSHTSTNTSCVMGLNFCVNKDDPGPLFDTGLSHSDYSDLKTLLCFYLDFLCFYLDFIGRLC